MTQGPPRNSDQQHVAVLINGVPASWLLQVDVREDFNLALTLVAPDRTWTANGTDLFDALMNLRDQLDEMQIRLCCNGARRNAWASGMQRDMGGGREVYLLELDRPGRPLEAETLGDAPCDQVATVREQKDFYADWLARRSQQRS